MEGQWICVNINYSYIDSSSIQREIQREVKRIFKSDILDVLIVDANFGSSGAADSDNYVFVKCRDYRSHIVGLRESKIISGVLDDYENPHFIPELEVNGFKSSVDESKQNQLHTGDVVLILAGYLKDMYGVVLEATGPSKYDVMFKLYTRCFVRSLRKDNLVYKGNILDKIKS
jgi:transcription antitermination factor NusG